MSKMNSMLQVIISDVLENIDQYNKLGSDNQTRLLFAIISFNDMLSYHKLQRVKENSYNDINFFVTIISLSIYILYLKGVMLNAKNN